MAVAERRVAYDRGEMNVRDNVHQLVDKLPEERLEEALDYLAELNGEDDLSPQRKAAIEEGLEDLRQGRTITLDEYRRSRNL
jgi:predicted transcriptional regulator